MNERRRFEMLDGYRGIAAVAVLCFHATLGEGLRLAPYAYLAVDFFFMLSGFVIASAYEARLADGMTVAAFARLRIERLYPLIAFTALLGAIFAARDYDRPTLAVLVVTGLLLIPTPLAARAHDHSLIALNPFAWSLLWEIVANIFYAAARPRLHGARLCLPVALGFVATAAAALHFGTMDFGSQWRNGWAGPARPLFGFFMGIALFRGWRAGRFARVRLDPLVAAVLLCAVFVVPRAGPAAPVIDLGVVLIVFPLVVLAGANADAGRWAPLCAAAGRLSYPLYVLQGGVFAVLHTLPAALGLADAAATGFTIALMLGYALFAQAVLKAIDEPAQAWLAARRCRGVRYFGTKGSSAA